MDFGQRRKSKLGTRRSSILSSGFQIPSLSCPRNETEHHQFINPNNVLSRSKKPSLWESTVETPHFPPNGQEPVKNLLSVWSSNLGDSDRSRSNLAGKNYLSDRFEKNIKIFDNDSVSKNNVKSSILKDKTNPKSISSYNMHRAEVKPSKCALFKSLIECSPDDSFLNDIKPLSPVVVNCISKEETLRNSNNDNTLVPVPQNTVTPAESNLPNKELKNSEIKVEKINSNSSYLSFESEKLTQTGQNLKLNVSCAIISDISKINSKSLISSMQPNALSKESSKLKTQGDDRTIPEKVTASLEMICSRQDEFEKELNTIIDIMYKQSSGIRKIKHIVETLKHI